MLPATDRVPPSLVITSLGNLSLSMESWAEKESGHWVVPLDGS